MEVFKGGTADLKLGSLLDAVPDDIQGDKGLARDEAGVEKLKERQAEIEEAAERKAEAIIAAEQAKNK